MLRVVSSYQEDETKQMLERKRVSETAHGEMGRKTETLT